MAVNFGRLAFAVLAATVLRGQEPVPPEAAERAAGWFKPKPGEKPLACAVRPLAPALAYRLAYRAGYLVTVPVAQLSGEQRNLRALVRITPDRAGAEPLLLEGGGTLPPASDDEGRDVSNFEAQIAGGFYLGEGRYYAELALIDSRQRVCRKQWDLELKPARAQKTALAPGRLAAFSQLGRPRAGDRAGRLTVFLHAGLSRGNTILLESLSGIVERMPFRHVQVVAFSLDQHKELLRQDMAGEGGFQRIAEALRSHSAGTVSYDVLQDRSGHRDFLWQLLAKESLRAEPADAVLFLGYTTLDDARVFVPPACAEGSRKTVYAYLDYGPPGRVRDPLRAPVIGPRRATRVRGRSGGGIMDDRGIESEVFEDEPPRGLRQPPATDAISRVTRACSGKVFHIYSPADLASALQRTNEILGGR